jgi:hypothetical protein
MTATLCYFFATFPWNHKHESDSYATAVMPPPEGPGKRHKFIARAEFIRDRDGVSRAESLSRARTEFPETYVSYQGHVANRSLRQQALHRGHNFIGKAAPDTFQDLCAAELKKSAGSLTHEMAAQRVCQQYGFRAFDNEMYKGESKLTEGFEKRVNRLIAEGYSEDAVGSCGKPTRRCSKRCSWFDELSEHARLPSCGRAAGSRSPARQDRGPSGRRSISPAACHRCSPFRAEGRAELAFYQSSLGCGVPGPAALFLSGWER